VLTDQLDSLHTLAILIELFEMQQTEDLRVLKNNAALQVLPFGCVKSRRGFLHRDNDNDTHFRSISATDVDKIAQLDWLAGCIPRSVQHAV
jgi:hypothetical protein